MSKLTTILHAGALAISFVAPARAGAEQEALAIVEQFKKAYDASNPSAITNLFAPGAVFLGTQMQGPTRDAKAILKYFEDSAAANLPKKVVFETYEVLEISETAFLFSGKNVFHQTRDGKPVENLARFSLLVSKGPQGWLISHFHSSRRP